MSRNILSYSPAGYFVLKCYGMAETLWENLFRKRAEAKNIREILRSTPIFSDLSSRELKMVEKIIHRRFYRDGEIIFHQGDPGVGMYVIARGKVRIFMTDERGTVVDLVTLGVGDFFGETSVIDGGVRSASAQAIGDTELLGFFRPDLFAIIERFPKLGAKILLKIAMVYSQRLRNTNAELMKARRLLEELEKKPCIP